VSRLDIDRALAHQAANLLRSAVLLLGMAGLLAALGFSLAGPVGLFWALGFGMLAVLFGPGLSPRWLLKLYRARRLAPAELPEVQQLLAWLSRRAGLAAPPALYYVPSEMLNAFAVGSRRHATIAVTHGLLRRLSGRELAGVLAHEIGHIRHGDLWIMCLADSFSRLTRTLANVGMLLLLLSLPVLLLGGGLPWLFVLLLLFSPTLSALLQLALSRTREFHADVVAARLTGDPEGLAQALVQLERLQGNRWENLLLPGRRLPDPSLLRTHPPTEERVSRLLNLRREEPAGLPLPRRPVQFPASFTVPVHPPRFRLSSGLWR